MTDELRAAVDHLRRSAVNAKLGHDCMLRRAARLRCVEAIPALINAVEALIGLQRPEHDFACEKRFGYDRCRCDKDEIDAALADLMAALKGEQDA